VRARLGFTASAVVALAVFVWVAVAAPEVLPAHRDAVGQVTRWAPKSEVLWALGGTAAGTGALFVALAAVIPRLPGEFINSPHKEYWLDAARRPRFDAMVRADLMFYGALTMVFVAVLAALVSFDVSGPWFWVLTGGYLVVTLGTALRTVAGGRYRPPAAD
jgi:hypothetical protein